MFSRMTDSSKDKNILNRMLFGKENLHIKFDPSLIAAVIY